MEIVGRLAFGTAGELKLAFTKEGNKAAVRTLAPYCEAAKVVYSMEYNYVKHEGEDAETFWRQYG